MGEQSPSGDLGPFAIQGAARTPATQVQMQVAAPRPPDVAASPRQTDGAGPAPEGGASEEGSPGSGQASGESPELLTPTQRRTHSDLLCVGVQRPFSPPKLPEQLREIVRERTEGALAGWTESSLFMTKSRVASVLACEGKAAAEMRTSWSGRIHPATAVGTVSHRAIQIAHTHPGHPVARYVSSAIAASVQHDSAFAEFYTAADLGAQSDLMSQAASKVTLFLDSWPHLSEAWNPRFEEPIQAKVGRLTLSARPDLVLGRPKADGRRTVFMCDFKTGSLSDRHDQEAMFYALVATLRHGMVPFRSAVYSLASAEWVAPELDAASLTEAAVRVSDAVVALVQVATDSREAALSPGPHCAWCPLSDSCAVSQARAAAPEGGLVQGAADLRDAPSGPVPPEAGIPAEQW